MGNLYEPPPVEVLPLVKGQDVDIEITYTVLLVGEDGEPILDEDDKEQYIETDFPEGSSIQLIVEPAVGVGTIDGSKARMRIDHLLVDKIKAGVLWRIVLTLVDDLDQVLLHGKTKRFDG